MTGSILLSYTKKGRDETPIIVVNDPLQWWKVNCHRFPLVAEVARRVPAFPATSARSEMISLRRVKSLRNTLAASVVAMLSCCYFCARCGQCLATFRPTTVLKGSRGRWHSSRLQDVYKMLNSSSIQPQMHILVELWRMVFDLTSHVEEVAFMWLAFPSPCPKNEFVMRMIVSNK